MRALSLIAQEFAHEDPSEHKVKSKRIIEALLFSTDTPLSIEKLQAIITLSHPIDEKGIHEALALLKEEYERSMRSFELIEKASGYQLRSKADFAPFVEELFADWHREKLSKAATEVLAIIAYRGPITRAAIEKIRGVDSSGALSTLFERKLIEITGRLQTLGRPSQYGTTQRFLDHFGLRSLEDLRAKETHEKSDN